MAQIVERDAFLFVEESDSDWLKPVVWFLYYPVGVRVSYNPDLIGRRCVYSGHSGAYRVLDYGSDLVVYLESAGATKPDPRWTNEVPIPKPRGKGWTYRQGAWRKPNGKTY